MSAPDITWLEAIKIGQALLGTVVGGGLVLLGGWLSDRRKSRTENAARARQQRALLTGMFAVRNHIATRLTEWEADGLLSRLEPLRTAQTYVHRMIDKTPGESEILMITVIEIGLKLDSLIATLDRRSTDPNSRSPKGLAQMITLQAEELTASLEQFDIISGQELIVLSDDDLAQFSGFSIPTDENQQPAGR
ncbi:MAG: hypothetical protein P0Y50_03905 [Candidatus Brevundimonas colombiensis]|uniref:Uncharacterized protein n=1 Tax=Candidatus Brevundimonas colombiensis TaxID=3121376 RepID=A0AAJ5X1L0_9CAUL|nr:hypothetical protein [Brevundimonas sp.]WEK40765.1 MAG: hypothetical protein P0Y50_03905 [Brevundimonas sp.]